MLERLLVLFSYPFLLRALVVGTMVSLCGALLGVNLVLKRYSMIGDGLSHVGFGALALAVPLGVAPLWFAIPMVVLAAFFLLRITESGRMRGDAAIGVISSASLALGVVALSLYPGSGGDLTSYLFGSVLATSQSDLVLSAVLSLAVLGLFIQAYHQLFAVAFDEAFAKATGIPVERYNLLIAVLTAVTIVVGMRVMGAMLISSLVLFPSLSAMSVCKSYRGVVLTAAFLSVIGFTVGLCLSFLINTPTGATVVLTNLVILLLCRCLRGT